MSAKRSAGTKRSLTILNTILLASAFSVPAFAQIETVVVTAEKRAQDVQTVPIAISVFNSDKRDAIGINSIQDMTNFTPGLQYNTSTDRISLRGVGRQTNVLSADASVANYDDGMYETFAVAAGRSALDLDRVEVLRGPQGTLSGRNAIAGALNEITRRPNADAFEGEFRDTYGSYNHNTLEGRLSGPLNDVWAYGLYFVWDKQTEGYIKNIVPGRPDEGAVLNDIYIDAQIQAKWNSAIEMWTKFQTAKWFNGAGNAGSQSGGWTPADSPTYEYGVAATGLNPGYGCTSIPGGTGATTFNTQTSVLPGSVVSPVADPCHNPGVDTPWQRQRLIPYNVKLPKYYAINSQWTYHTDADFDVKYIFGATYYDYRLTGPASPGSGAAVDQDAPINSYTIAPFGVGGLNISGDEAFIYREENSFYSNEINLVSTGDSPVQWVVGAYQFQQHYYQPVLTHDENQPQWNNGTPNFGDPVSNAFVFCTRTAGVCAPSVDHRRFDNRPANQATSYAGFGQVDWQVADEWKVTLGGRYSWDRKYGHESVRLICFAVPACYTAPEANLFIPGGLPATDLTQLATVVDAGLPSHPVTGLPRGVVANTSYDPATGFATRIYDSNWSAITGNVGVEWQPDEDTNLYAKYGRGYKSGGFNIGIFTVLSFTPWTDKETVDSFEIGAKKTWGDWLTTNVAVFYYDYKNLQIPIAVTQTAGGLSQSSTAFLNVPKSISQGAELEATIAPIDNLALIFNYSYNDAHVTRGFAADPADPTATAPGAQPLYTDAQCLAMAQTPSPEDDRCSADVYTPSTIATGMPVAGAPGCGPASGNTVAQTAATAGTCTSFAGWNKPQNLSGQQLPNAAKNKVAINVMYTWDTDFGTFQPSVSYVWRDKQYGTLFTRSYTAAPAWSQVDARIRWKSEDEHYEVILFGKNLTDEIGYDAGATATRMAGSVVLPVGQCGTGVGGPTYVGGGYQACNFVQGVNGPSGYTHIRGTNSRGIASTYSVVPPQTWGIEVHYKFD